MTSDIVRNQTPEERELAKKQAVMLGWVGQFVSGLILDANAVVGSDD
jgi:hypothetical protein